MPPIAHPPVFYAKIAGICFVVRALRPASERNSKGRENGERRVEVLFGFDREKHSTDLDLDLDDVQKKVISQRVLPSPLHSLRQSIRPEGSWSSS